MHIEPSNIVLTNQFYIDRDLSRQLADTNDNRWYLAGRRDLSGDITRCKDCRYVVMMHSLTERGDYLICYRRKVLSAEVSSNHFCGYGERR